MEQAEWMDGWGCECGCECECECECHCLEGGGGEFFLDMVGCSQLRSFKMPHGLFNFSKWYSIFRVSLYLLVKPKCYPFPLLEILKKDFLIGNKSIFVISNILYTFANILNPKYHILSMSYLSNNIFYKAS